MNIRVLREDSEEEKPNNACKRFLNIFVGLVVVRLALCNIKPLPRFYAERLDRVKRWLEGMRYEARQSPSLVCQAENSSGQKVP